MKDSKTLPVVIIGILVVLALGEFGLRAIPDLPDPIAWPSAASEVKHAQLNGRSFDVVLLGSSVTEAAVDPEILGFDSYNAALPFSAPSSSEDWYRTHFGDRGASVVILGVRAWTEMGGDGGDVLLEGFDIARKRETRSESPFLLFENRGLLADWHERSVRRRAIESDLWTDRGHQTGYYDRRGETLAGRFGAIGPPEVSSDFRASTVKLAELVRDQQGTFVLMVEPGRYPGGIPEQTTREYLTALRELAGEIGAVFWDTYSIDWPDEYYADESHFNRAGTAAFTEYLRPLVAELLN